MQEWTLEGRLFQIAGAVERKRRAPNEMLQRVTEKVGRGRRYSSAWSVPLDQISQIWGGVTGTGLWVIVAWQF